MDKNMINLIVKRITNLITVKSIISLALLFVFCYLTFNQLPVPEELASVFGYVIAFFLGSQMSKDSNKNETVDKDKNDGEA